MFDEPLAVLYSPAFNLLKELPVSASESPKIVFDVRSGEARQRVVLAACRSSEINADHAECPAASWS